MTTFTDSTFYDISTWNFPYTFDVYYAELNSLKGIEFSSEVNINHINGKIIGGKSGLGYLMKWNEFTSPKALYTLQNAGLLTKVATEKFGFEIENNTESFTYGTILIPVHDQPLNANQIFELVGKTAKETGIDFYGLTTGLSPQGIDWGSNSFELLKKPEVLLFVGGSVSSSDAGEIWHLFDQRYQIPLTLVETDDIKSVDLTKYNTVILPGGSYREFDQSDSQKIKTWVQGGGNLILYKTAVSWASRNDVSKVGFKKGEQADSTLFPNYADRNKKASLNTISGAIFNTELDITHPLCYGYNNRQLPVFKTGTHVAESLGKPYAEPVKFSSEPYLSGLHPMRI